MRTEKKQAADQLDYDVDFSGWLPEGDVITTAIPSVDIVGELVIDQVQYTGQIVKVWLSGGVNGGVYKITVIASTSQGRIKEIEFRLRVRDL